MKIGGMSPLAVNPLLEQLKSQSMQAQSAVNTDIAPQKVQNPNASSFGDMLSNAINNVNDLGHESRGKINAFEMGDKSVTLAEVMIAKEKSGIAFEATVQVRNKLLEAYEKVMQMPV